MSGATLDYLLRLAIAHRDALALASLGDDRMSPEWGEAAAAVRELLDMRGRK
jgi:ABC-type antimicrobial peptide transport system permease subunit